MPVVGSEVRRALIECGVSNRDSASLAMRKNQGGDTPCTTTPPAMRSSSPSSDSCGQRWDHIPDSVTDSSAPVVSVALDGVREKKPSFSSVTSGAGGAGSSRSRDLAAGVGRRIPAAAHDPGSASTARAPKEVLAPGVTAVIDLPSSPDINGTTALCETWMNGSARWRVRLENGRYKNIKPQNLKLQSEVCPTALNEVQVPEQNPLIAESAGEVDGMLALAVVESVDAVETIPTSVKEVEAAPNATGESTVEPAAEPAPARKTWAEIARSNLPPQPAKQAGSRAGAPANTGLLSPSVLNGASRPRSGSTGGTDSGVVNRLVNGSMRRNGLGMSAEPHYPHPVGALPETGGTDQAEIHVRLDMNPTPDRSSRSEQGKHFADQEPNNLAAGCWLADGADAVTSVQAPTHYINSVNGEIMTVPCIQIPDAKCTESELTDRRIIEGLAAKESCHERLLRTAHGVRAFLYSIFVQPKLQESVWVELYGSLALYGSRNPNDHEPWQQDWARHYVRAQSDIDLVVLISKGATPTLVVNRLEENGGWTLVSQTFVPKFCTTQFTLKGWVNDDQDYGERAEVWLDLTCIDSRPHYNRFKGRQEAFQHIFKSVRENLAFRFGTAGALAFDAYIYLLKGFATKVPGNAMTSFQATCFGLFALQLGLYELKCCQPTGLVLFECFLRFCSVFFNDEPANQWSRFRGYKYSTVDLSFNGRLLPRFSSKWRCEAYFLSVEVQLGIKFADRVNIAHSLIPSAVCAAAKEALQQYCTIHDGGVTWA